MGHGNTVPRPGKQRLQFGGLSPAGFLLACPSGDCERDASWPPQITGSTAGLSCTDTRRLFPPPHAETTSLSVACSRWSPNRTCKLTAWHTALQTHQLGGQLAKKQTHHQDAPSYLKPVLCIKRGFNRAGQSMRPTEVIASGSTRGKPTSSCYIGWERTP